MNSLKKIVLCALSLLSFTGAFAANKQQIRLSNQYGDDVFVESNWRKKSAPHTHNVTHNLLKSTHNNFVLKAPISGYELFSLDVSPAVNTQTLHFIQQPFGKTIANSLGSNQRSIASYIAHSLNKHRTHAHGHKSFIITAENYKTKISNQKQITIHGMNEAEYNKEIGNAEVVEVEDIPLSEANGNEIDDDSQAQANLDKLINAMR